LSEALHQTQAAVAAWIGSQQNAQEVVRQLMQFREEPERHYAEEEQGGCLEEAECRCPSLAGEVKRIELEHGTLRSDMDRLVAQASLLAKSSECVEQLEQAFQEFAARLRKHEAAENRVMAYGFGAEAVDEFTDEPNHF